MTCWLCGFDTTELVTDPKVPPCRNGPCQTCIAVAKVDEEINQAVATLRQLLVKRCDLRSEQNRVHGSLIHRLPVELKNHIFELLLPSWCEWVQNSTNIMPGKVTMPLYLTSICRSWRDIAWSNPVFWSTIYVGIGTQVSTSGPFNRINVVHQWILRSQTIPLNLYIVVREKEGFEEEFKGVIDSISQSSSRWHSLSLDIPWKMLPAFKRGNFQCLHLKRLRIYARNGWKESVNQPPVPFLNPQVNPRYIDVSYLSFQSLQISWNHLSCARVGYFTLEDITQLLRHALQMTYCHISSPRPGARNFSMPPIRHQRLKLLGLYPGRDINLGVKILGFLTLPCLQEFGTTEMILLNSTLLLVQRSSCPLTRIRINQNSESALGSLDLQPLPSVTELHLDSGRCAEKLLLDERFPNLHHLTLRLQPFLYLWENGTISKLLNPKRLRPETTNQGRHSKVRVIDRHRVDEFSALVWKSSIGRELKSLQLDIRLRGDGFEFLIPEASIDAK